MQDEERKAEKERWERNEHVRLLTLEQDRGRPAGELLAQTIELSRVSMKLRATVELNRQSGR